MVAAVPAIGIVIATPSVGFAQAPAQARDPAPIRATVLDNVRVEGRSVAAANGAVTTLDAGAIERARLRSLTQLQSQVPTLSIVATGGRAAPHYISLRGYTNPWSAPESAVPVYLDGVPVADVFSLGQRLLDVERIVVRRGPQGSAFGMNAEAGVIEVDTRAPDADARASLALSLDSRGGVSFGGAASGAFAPRATASIAVALDRSDGGIDNLAGRRPYDAQRGRNLQGKLRWQAGESVQFELLLLERHVDDRGGEQYLPIDRAAFNRLPTLQRFRLGPFDQAIDHEGHNRLDATLAALTTRWDVAGARWRAIASHRDSDSATSTDYDLSPQPWFVMDSHYRVREDHLELRGESRDGDAAKLHWLVGGSMDHRDATTLRLFTAGPGNPWFLPSGSYVRTDAALPDRTTALFGELHSRFGNDDRWGVLVGGRLERGTRRLDFGANALAAAAQRRRNDTRWLPKLAFDLRLAPAHALYASLAHGGRAGGFNPGAFEGSRAAYKPECTTAFELGANGSTRDSRVGYRVAAFRNRIDDYQDVVFSEREFTLHVANAKRASTRGMEAEMILQIAPRWRIEAMLGRVRARYDDYLVDPAHNLRLNGRPLQQVPRWNARVATRYDHGPWWLDVAATGAGGFAINAYDAPRATLREAVVPGHATLDLHAGWRGTHWALQLDTENLADRRYFTTATYGFSSLAGYAGAVGTLAPRRSIGLTLRREL